MLLLNILGVSVVIYMSKISTAWSYNPHYFTFSSLQMIAEAAPSLVGQH
jgi:hypothetical protein